MSTEVVATSAVSDAQQQSPSAPTQQNTVEKVNLLGMSRPQMEKSSKIWGRKSSVLGR